MNILLPGNVLALSAANTDCFPAGVICTIVVPVPWLLDFALKLLIR